MERRRFVGLVGRASLGLIFVPQFERWFRPLRGLYVADTRVQLTDSEIEQAIRNVYLSLGQKIFPRMGLLMTHSRKVEGRDGYEMFFDVVVNRGPVAPAAAGFHAGLPGGGRRWRRDLLGRPSPGAADGRG